MAATASVFVSVAQLCRTTTKLEYSLYFPFRHKRYSHIVVLLSKNKAFSLWASNPFDTSHKDRLLYYFVVEAMEIQH